MIRGAVPRGEAYHHHNEREGVEITTEVASVNARTLPRDSRSTDPSTLIGRMRTLVNEAREELVDAPRRRHADLFHVAPLRACFVTLARHSTEGLQKLHRLLVNVRQTMPVTSGRYPFVAFHEQEGSESAMLRTLLDLEISFQRSPVTGKGKSDTELFRDDSWVRMRSFFSELSRRQMWKKVQDEVREDNEDHLFSAARELDVSVLDRLDAPSLRILIRRFVFPRLVSHPDQLLSSHEKLRRRYNHVVGDISGFHFIALEKSEFGELPSNIIPEHERPWPYPGHSYWGVSYRHMCRFFGTRIFFNKFLVENRFDYYLRLDTDSFILSMPRFERFWSDASAVDRFFDSSGRRLHIHGVDPLEDYFEVMKRRGVKYAFSMLHPQTIHQFREGIWDLFDNFVSSEKLSKRETYRCPQAPLHLRSGRWTQLEHNDTQSAAVRVALGIPEDCGVSGGEYRPMAVLPFPRLDLVHFWDNFEIVDLEQFSPVVPAAAQGCNIFEDHQLLDDGPALDLIYSSSESSVPKLTEHLSPHLLLFNWSSLVKSRGIEVPLMWDQRLLGFQLSPEDLIEQTTIYGDLSHLMDVAAFFEKKQSLNRRVILKAANRLLQEMQDVSNRAEIARHLLAIEEWKECRSRALLSQRHHLTSRFIAAVDDAGGFYYHRWGDAEIHTLLISATLEPSELAFAESFPYQHYFNYHCPEKATVDGEVFGHKEPGAYEAACEAAARSSFPQLKEKGSARMSPAEMNHFNDAFAAWARSAKGGPPQII
jgi:hypothetical protein